MPNCKCGDAPVSQENKYREWEVHCLGCGIFIYAPTQEQAETIWRDAVEAAELRENLLRLEEENNWRKVLLWYAGFSLIDKNSELGKRILAQKNLMENMGMTTC